MRVRTVATTTKPHSSGPAPSCPTGIQPLKFLSDQPESPLRVTLSPVLITLLFSCLVG